MIYDPQVRNETPKSIFNPLIRDLEFEYLDDNNHPTIYTIKGQTIVTHPTYLADWMIKRIIDEVQNDREIGIATEADIEEIRKEIEVDLTNG